MLFSTSFMLWDENFYTSKLFVLLDEHTRATTTQVVAKHGGKLGFLGSHRRRDVGFHWSSMADFLQAGHPQMNVGRRSKQKRDDLQ